MGLSVVTGSFLREQAQNGSDSADTAWIRRLRRAFGKHRQVGLSQIHVCRRSWTQAEAYHPAIPWPEYRDVALLLAG